MELKNKWIAINEEGSKWYIGKIQNVEEICNKKILHVSSVMIQIEFTKAKYIKFQPSHDEVKQIFEDDVICQISPPKEMKKPKNVNSIKEISAIKNLLNLK